MGEHSGEEVERVEQLGFSIFRFGLIENVIALFVVMQSLKGDGAADDIAREDLKALGIEGIEVKIIRHGRRILMRSSETRSCACRSGHDIELGSTSSSEKPCGRSKRSAAEIEPDHRFLALSSSTAFEGNAGSQLGQDLE